MESHELIELVNGDKTKLQKWFDNFDSQSNNINDWQRLLNYPLETYSCQICHKIRTSIMTGLSFHFGVRHLNAVKLPSIAQLHFVDAVNYIEKGEKIRKELQSIYPKISELLYKS